MNHLVLLPIFIFLIPICKSQSRKHEFPQIFIKVWSNGKIYSENIDNQDVQDFMFPGNFDEIQLTCISAYPNKWSISSNPIKEGGLRKIVIDKIREVLDINDISTYVFVSELGLKFKDPVFHQNLSCAHVNRVLEKENVTTLVSLEGSNAGLQVGIFKGKAKNSSEGLHPRLGLNINCDLVLHFDKNSQKLGCSHNGQPVGSDAIRVAACNSTDECGFLIRSDKCSALNKPTVVNTCELSSCEKIHRAGAVICQIGDSRMSAARSFFMTAESPPTYYMNKEDVNISQVLKIKLLNNGSIFEKDTIYCTCFGAGSYFSKGFIWATQDEGRDDIQYIEKQRNETYSRDTQTYVTELQITGSNMTIICFAPVWNSVLWENVSIAVKVKVIPPPDLVGGDVIDEKNVTEHEAVKMVCELLDKNVPPVTFRWFQNGKNMHVRVFETKMFSMEFNESRSTLTIFDSILSSNYSCEALNTKGEWRQKHFNIEVNLAKTSSHTIIVAIGASVVVALLILIFFLYRKNRSQSLTIQHLSDDDILEFVNGDPKSNNALFYPYNVQCEISRKNFHIESKVLGSGQFGIVWKGRVGKAPVAIKSAKKGADVAYVKALLSELKIMSYVGRHDNIVCLIGACTEFISKSEVYVICEYCINGNVLKYVKDAREIFVDHNQHQKYGSFRGSTVDYQNSTVKKLSSKDLVRWAHEIACGMEFLSLKQVVHGDLAARNVLLTEHLTAKVGDFGLSKQLFQYSVYVQRQECPLPLRWMAIESLQDLEFSVQSDVWSYGVTLWEIFTLGRTPYPGVNWGFESWKMLKDGYRMDKPQFASENTYKAILECWNTDLTKRPDFTFLKTFFQEQSSLLVSEADMRRRGIKSMLK